MHSAQWASITSVFWWARARFRASTRKLLIRSASASGYCNPALSQNHIQLIKDTHGKTSQLSQTDLDALVLYLKSLQ